MEEKILQSCRQAYYILLKDDGRFPNNNRFPLLLYRGTIARVPVPQCDPVFGMNGPLIDLWSKNNSPTAQ